MTAYSWAMSMPSPTQRPRILLDCDPGHDDAIAIVVAARHTDLVGITTVAGNAPLERTTRNAIIIRDLLGIDVPGAHGRRPPVGRPRPCTPTTSTARAAWTAPTCPSRRGRRRAPTPSGFIIDTCRADEGIWLVPTGPLTNIALALRAAPDLADRIAGISLMGGGTFGNRTATAEFNIWCDPEAAADRVRVRRSARHVRAAAHPHVPGDARTDRAGACVARHASRRCWPTCSSSSAAPT